MQFENDTFSDNDSINDDIETISDVPDEGGLEVPIDDAEEISVESGDEDVNSVEGEEVVEVPDELNEISPEIISEIENSEIENSENSESENSSAEVSDQIPPDNNDENESEDSDREVDQQDAAAPVVPPDSNSDPSVPDIVDLFDPLMESTMLGGPGNEPVEELSWSQMLEDTMNPQIEPDQPEVEEDSLIEPEVEESFQIEPDQTESEVEEEPEEPDPDDPDDPDFQITSDDSLPSSEEDNPRPAIATPRYRLRRRRGAAYLSSSRLGEFKIKRRDLLCIQNNEVVTVKVPEI